MGFLVLNLDGTELQVLFGRGVSEVLVNESQNSDDNQDNTSQFHNDPFVV
jgi:hypothetical protein